MRRPGLWGNRRPPKARASVALPPRIGSTAPRRRPPARPMNVIRRPGGALRTFRFVRPLPPLIPLSAPCPPAFSIPTRHLGLSSCLAGCTPLISCLPPRTTRCNPPLSSSGFTPSRFPASPRVLSYSLIDHASHFSITPLPSRPAPVTLHPAHPSPPGPMHPHPPPLLHHCHPSLATPSQPPSSPQTALPCERDAPSHPVF